MTDSETPEETAGDVPGAPAIDLDTEERELIR